MQSNIQRVLNGRAAVERGAQEVVARVGGSGAAEGVGEVRVGDPELAGMGEGGEDEGTGEVDSVEGVLEERVWRTE